MDKDLAESIIGKETMCVQRAKSCWTLLTEGYTARGPRRGNVLGSPGKGKGKDRVAYDSDEEDTSHFDEEEDAVVGEDAWPVLEWLLVLFEQDELVTVGRGSREYSLRPGGIIMTDSVERTILQYTLTANTFPPERKWQKMGYRGSTSHRVLLSRTNPSQP